MEISKGGLYADIKNILEQARSNAVRAVNFSMAIAYWEIGKRIVEEEQSGSKRLRLDKECLKNYQYSYQMNLAKGLTKATCAICVCFTMHF